MSERTELSIQAQAPLDSDRLLLAKLAVKVLAVMEAVERIPKKGWNEHFKYAFAAEADVMDTVRQECIKQKLLVLPGILASSRIGNITLLKMEFTFIDAETGFAYTKFWEGEGQDTQDKGTSKAGTSGEKYFLLKAFMIPTGSDPDADGPEKQEKPKPPAKAKQTPKAEVFESPAKEAGAYLTKTLEFTSSEYRRFTEYHAGTWVDLILEAKKMGITNKAKLLAFPPLTEDALGLSEADVNLHGV